MLDPKMALPRSLPVPLAAVPNSRRSSTFAATRNGADIITDFSRAEGDRINLRQVDANADVGGDQNFAFIGDAAFSGAAGELRYAHAQGNTYIEGDTNGDGSADFMIRLDGMHVVDAADFVV